MRKTILLLTILILLSSATALADIREPTYNPITKDYRPLYNFSYDVFKELPSFPKDFWLKKHLFDTQQIPASRLTPEYYLQPELIPGWFNWCNETYGDNNPHMIGMYGINIYPSRFDVFNMQINDTVNISTLLYTSFGVELYQGAKIIPKYDNESIKITLLKPETNIFLLKPTYPYFDSEWCTIVEYQIQLLKPGNHTIELYEEKPPTVIDNNWKNKYRAMYTSGGSILGLQIPKMKIFIHAYQGEEKNEDNEDMKSIAHFDNELLMFILFLISSLIILMWSLHVRRKKKENKT